MFLFWNKSFLSGVNIKVMFIIGNVDKNFNVHE